MMFGIFKCFDVLLYLLLLCFAVSQLLDFESVVHTIKFAFIFDRIILHSCLIFFILEL